MATTSRQEIALLLYYGEGLSYRRIGKALGIDGKTAYDLVERAKDAVLRISVESPPHTLPIVRALFSSTQTASPTGHLGRALSRQDELLDALELRMEQRALELASFEQMLSGNSSPPQHRQQNRYDQWELRYLQGKKGEPLPTSAYQVSCAATACAAQGNGCKLNCYGCKKR